MKRVRLAAYDGGYGLIISEDVGDEVPAMFRIAGDQFRIKLPDPFTDESWAEQKRLVNEMVTAYNEKFGLTRKE